MKYVFTALILVFVTNGCVSNKLNNPKVETKYTFTTLVENQVGKTSAYAVGPGSLGTALVSLVSMAEAEDKNKKLLSVAPLTDVRINGKRLRYGCNKIKSKGKLVVTYKDDKEIAYLRKGDFLLIHLYNGLKVDEIKYNPSIKLMGCK